MTKKYLRRKKVSQRYTAKKKKFTSPEMPYKKRPGSKAVKEYLAREVDAGRLSGPFHSGQELVRDLEREKRLLTKRN